MREGAELSSTVIASNLSYNTTEDELARFFKSCGEIRQVRIVTGKDKLSKG